MSILSRLFGKKPKDPDQAVFVHLDGQGLPDEVVEACDLATLEDKLIEALSEQRLGDVDGNEIGPEIATVVIYGHDAERMFAAIEPVLRTYPLCRGARVEIRRGPPGAAVREVRIPSDPR